VVQKKNAGVSIPREKVENACLMTIHRKRKRKQHRKPGRGCIFAVESRVSYLGGGKEGGTCEIRDSNNTCVVRRIEKGAGIGLRQRTRRQGNLLSTCMGGGRRKMTAASKAGIPSNQWQRKGREKKGEGKPADQRPGRRDREKKNGGDPRFPTRLRCTAEAGAAEGRGV